MACTINVDHENYFLKLPFLLHQQMCSPQKRRPTVALTYLSNLTGCYPCTTVKYFCYERNPIHYIYIMLCMLDLYVNTMQAYLLLCYVPITTVDLMQEVGKRQTANVHFNNHVH